ncbi:MAG: shikimate dehydrogenase [Acetobacteraceae bacterium]|nr:shikimate dehydrogenase [Acetobacteraceae bacterium]
MPTRDAHTYLTGLIGTGIGASLTPAMHEREAAEQGFRQIYQIIDLSALKLGVEALPELLIAAQRMGFTGLNITHPCKQAIIPLLDELSPHAKALNAVNTVLFRDGRSIGHNTDWSGYAEAFRRGLPKADLRRVVQIGTGGAGGAVAYALLTLGVQTLMLHDIDPSRAEAVAASLCETFGAGRAVVVSDPQQDIASASGLVNCTPIGMAKYPGTAVPVEFLHSGLFVSEIIYFPLETELLRAAKAIGCQTLNGGGMAVFQAVDAFRLFTDAAPDAERMRRHFAQLTGAV